MFALDQQSNVRFWRNAEIQTDALPGLPFPLAFSKSLV
jgi:hypothetical protein